jgi:succinate dehydrogenase/fumarate reductase flavoprotein subunit
MAVLKRWTHEVDVVAVGSGAAGLTAAILAHDHGAKALILESTDKVGGTTAVSGGGVWVPTNARMAEIGIQDSRDEALMYCKTLTMGRADDALVETYVDNAVRMIEYLERKTPLKFSPITAPDYHPEVKGGKLGGRALEPTPFDTKTLGEWRSRLRPPSALAFPITLQEVYGTFQAFYQPWKIPQDLLIQRMSEGMVCLGQALAAGLLKAVLDRGIPISLETRALELVRDGSRVIGIHAQRGKEPIDIRARGGVVLASAGFEWNESLKSRFLSGRVPVPNTPPCNFGDGLLMAMEVGADLGNMGEVWHYPSLHIPGETYDNRPLSRGIKAERSGPHVIWVNRRGERFVNEAANYNSVGKAFFTMEANEPSYRNVPAWAVFDQQYREKYAVGTTMPEDPDPAYVHRADSLEALAAKAGIHAERLQETVARWNGFSREGKDRDFGKGNSAFDRFQGAHDAKFPNFGTIEKPPFYALPVHAGVLGTKGGPRTNPMAQVMSVRDERIPGLYAAGNVAASVTGPSYYGIGSTLGPALTFGYIAGRCAAEEARQHR